MFDRILASNSIPFVVASNAASMDELRDSITRSCDPINIWLPKRRLETPAQYKLVHLDGVDIGWSAGFDETRFHLKARARVRQFIPLSGAALLVCQGRTVDNLPSRAVVVPANADHVMAFGAGYRNIILSIDEFVLQRKFRALVGADEASPVLLGSIDMALPRSRGLMRAIHYSLQELDIGGADLPQAILTELSEFIVLSFLLASEIVLQDKNNKPQAHTTRRQLQRVVEYLEQNWREPFDSEKLAAVAGTSARTIFRAFKQQYGEGPAQFLRRIRLHQARKMFLQAGPTASVIGISLMCGFANTGHFAHHYQNLFGEMPNETLRSGKSQL